MRDDVVGKLEGELLDRRLLAGTQFGILSHQFVHGCRTGAARRLIGRNADAADMRQVLDSLQRNDHLNRRAVRVGNDPARRIDSVFRIHFGHDQRNVRVHAKRARIVDHQRAVLRNRLGKLLGSACPGRDEGYVYALEIVVMSQQAHPDLFSPERIDASRAPLGAEQQQLVRRKIPLLEHFQQLLTDSSARSDNRNFHNSAF